MIRAGIAAQIQYDLLDIDVEELAKADCNSCVIVRKFFAPTRPKFFNAIDPNSPFEWDRFDVLTSG